MDFNLQDLKLLYGPSIYWLETEEKQFNQNAIAWKNKPQGKITFVIDEPEIKDKNLTSLLKNIVAAIQIPFEAVNFGVITQPVYLRKFPIYGNRTGCRFWARIFTGCRKPHLLSEPNYL
jgi:hypothetical protein